MYVGVTNFSKFRKTKPARRGTDAEGHVCGTRIAVGRGIRGNGLGIGRRNQGLGTGETGDSVVSGPVMLDHVGLQPTACRWLDRT
jgi:hypothetical protein